MVYQKPLKVDDLNPDKVKVVVQWDAMKIKCLGFAFGELCDTLQVTSLDMYLSFSYCPHLVRFRTATMGVF